MFTTLYTTRVSKLIQLSITHITGRTDAHIMTQTEYEQNIINKANARSQGTYDIYFEIDIDCQELLDAIGLEYQQCKDDNTQNEVLISLTPEEATDVLDQSVLSMTNEQTLAAAVLNHELSEYTTSAVIETPQGDRIIFE